MVQSPTNSVWDDSLLVNPHGVSDKRGRVQKMFAAIAPSYDLNNRLHSLWMDQTWRSKAVKLAAIKPTDRIVDVACGTGDLTLKFALRLAELNGRAPKAGQVIGIDFTYEMLPIARVKGLHCAARFSAGMSAMSVDGGSENMICWLNGDALALPLPDASADVVSIAFGIRNVSDPAAAVGEFYRVLRPGGRLIILEFSLPANPALLAMYNVYFKGVLPHTATWISGDKSGAYKYLPQSVNTFIGRETMAGLMRSAGFAEVEQHAMTFGICVCYRGVKPVE